MPRLPAEGTGVVANDEEEPDSNGRGNFRKPSEQCVPDLHVTDPMDAGIVTDLAVVLIWP